MSSRWATCWKCSGNIKTQSDSNYVKTRDGNLSLCPECYNQFRQLNVDFFRPDASRQEELERSLHNAMRDFHDKVMKRNGGITTHSNINDLPNVIVHNSPWMSECAACMEIFNLRCARQCPKREDLED